MPIRVQNELPAREILEGENIFVMDEGRAGAPGYKTPGDRYPEPDAAERGYGAAASALSVQHALQVNVTFVHVASHESKNTATSHLNKFYVSTGEIMDRDFDGMIITGAPVEQLEFEEVDYWEELCRVFDWTKDHVTSTIHLCWGAQAGLYHHFGLKKRKLDKKMFGLFWHRVKNRKIPLVRGFDDMFLAPHSRHTEVSRDDIAACEDLMILAESDEAGVFLAMTRDGRQIYVMGHPEYDRITLDQEYKRDLGKGLPIEMPENYYTGGNPENRPLLMWRAHANNLYTNWLNYYVYQITPYKLFGTPF